MARRYNYPRRVTIPRVREARLSNSYATVVTDSGTVTSAGAEKSLSITGANGITVTATEGDPDSIIIDGSSLADGQDWKEDEFTPSNDQISFSLSEAPNDEQSVFFLINGVVYDDTSDYTVSGQTITWTNSLFNIEDTDQVIIKYV